MQQDPLMGIRNETCRPNTATFFIRVTQKLKLS